MKQETFFLIWLGLSLIALGAGIILSLVGILKP